METGCALHYLLLVLSMEVIKVAAPLIGVTAGHVNNEQGHPAVLLLQAYITAVRDAGGLPIIIPPDTSLASLPQLVERLDGILFTGGGDLTVEHARGKPHPLINGVDSVRDELELSLLAISMKNDLPFLGICRGIQLINAGLGGSLFTHIADQLPSAIKHDYFPDYPREKLAHSVEVRSGTHLAQIAGSSAFQVNSLHHQGVDRLARQARAAACSPDGLIEAIEIPSCSYALAVQWHPEWLTDQEHARRLFQSLVAAAERHIRT